MQLPSRTSLAAVAAILALLGCNYSNPHGSQDLPPVKRLISDPPGATVYIERLNLQLETPCDLPEVVFEAEMLVVSKNGFVPYRGRLDALPQAALGTYQCVLQRR